MKKWYLACSRPLSLPPVCTVDIPNQSSLTRHVSDVINLDRVRQRFVTADINLHSGELGNRHQQTEWQNSSYFMCGVKRSGAAVYYGGALTTEVFQKYVKRWQEKRFEFYIIRQGWKTTGSVKLQLKIRGFYLNFWNFRFISCCEVVIYEPTVGYALS